VSAQSGQLIESIDQIYAMVAMHLVIGSSRMLAPSKIIDCSTQMVIESTILSRNSASVTAKWFLNAVCNTKKARSS